jgi:hypothetical protein
MLNLVILRPRARFTEDYHQGKQICRALRDMTRLIVLECATFIVKSPSSFLQV